MSRQALLALLHQRIGLDSGSLGARVIDDAFAEARATLAVADDEALYGKALVHREAFFDIVERFVVPESWFFRAGDQYADLARYAREQRDRRPLRILSLPCASGEEAYSAIMTLIDAGLPPDDIDVLGIDVSRAAVQRAQAGVFRSNSLRGQPMPKGWVEPRIDGFAIADNIRARARFRMGNALDPSLLAASERFDVVFCRNLLIYLHPDARAQVLKTLLAALEPRGLLLVGQAEVMDMTGNDLRPYEGGCPLSYVRDASAPVVAARIDTAPVRPRQPVPAVRARPCSRDDRSGMPEVEMTPQALADAGHLDEARAACAKRLKRHPEDLDALFLLGLVESARGDLDAADAAFTRVCFLDRDHVAAMDHRIALAERLGRAELAGDLRRRTQRMRERHGKSP